MRGVALIAALTALVGCGAGSTTASTRPSTTPSTAPSTTGATPATSLTIRYWPNGSGEGVQKTWTLRCHPVGGTHTRRAAACRRLDALRNPFARPRPDLMCTQQYGGPQQARITGVHEGRPVTVSLGLADGCQIARFAKLAFLVPGFSVTESAAGS